MRTDETHRLGEALRFAVENCTGALGRLVPRCEPGASGRDDQSGEAIAQSRQRRGDVVGTVGRHLVTDHLELGCGELLDERPPAGVVTRTCHHSVADGQHLCSQLSGPHAGAR